MIFGELDALVLHAIRSSRPSSPKLVAPAANPILGSTFPDISNRATIMRLKSRLSLHYGLKCSRFASTSVTGNHRVWFSLAVTLFLK